MHPRLEHAADAVALEQEGQARDVVLVRMAQDDRVDPAVPRRDPPIEGHQQAIGIGSAVDEEPAAPGALDEDRVALPDVEDRDPGAAAGCRGDDRTGDEQRADERDGADPARRATGGRRLDAARRCRHRPDLGIRTAPPAAAPPCRFVALVRRDHDQAGQRQGRRRGRHDVERRFEGDARERQAGRRRDDRHQDAEDHPAGSGDDRADDRRRSGQDEAATRQRDDAGGHGRRDQRDDDEVDDGRQDRQPAERDEDDRQRRGLGRERDAEAFREPAREAAAAGALDPSGQRGRPGDEARRGQRRQLEAGIADQARIA